MSRFHEDILAQPAVWTQVLDHACGPGRAALAAAAARIRAAPRVVVTSMGSALISSMPMARELARLHPRVSCEETAEVLRAPLDPQALYLVQSRSGESREVAQLARAIPGSGAQLIAITMTPTSTLARHAHLVIEDPASFDGLICTKAFTSLTLVGLLLAAWCEGEPAPTLVRALSACTDALAQATPTLAAAIDALPLPRTGITFLAEGAGMCLAHAGALWTEEAARVRASAMSFAQFRHGPIEQVDAAFLGCWIDLVPTTATRAMHAELCGHGGQIEVVAPLGAYPRSWSLPLAELPESWRVVPAAVPVQLLAHRLALVHGQEPGVMRYQGWVIT